VSYTCPHCGATSHNPNDERERYCGRCHRFADDETGLRRYASWSTGRLSDEQYADALEADGVDDPTVEIIIARLRDR
jgi:hypothetical protein